MSSVRSANRVAWAEVEPGKHFGFWVTYGVGTKRFGLGANWRPTLAAATRRGQKRMEQLQNLVDRTRGLNLEHQHRSEGGWDGMWAKCKCGARQAGSGGPWEMQP